jgi:hypothetical protein
MWWAASNRVQCGVSQNQHMSVYGLLLICKHSVFWLLGTTAHEIYMGSDSINRYYVAPCLFGLPFGNGTALRSVMRSIFD